MTEYSLDAPFYIDNDELAGVSSRDAFVLGAEFAMFYGALMKDSAEFTIQIHLKNVDRCVALCELHKRKARSTVSGAWVSLSVGARITS